MLFSLRWNNFKILTFVRFQYGKFRSKYFMLETEISFVHRPIRALFPCTPSHGDEWVRISMLVQPVRIDTSLGKRETTSFFVLWRIESVSHKNHIAAIQNWRIHVYVTVNLWKPRMSTYAESTSRSRGWPRQNSNRNYFYGYVILRYSCFICYYNVFEHKIHN